ncbi:endolytic transglycosylase MltG [Spirochaetia bacterium 38H-sp]|uniref:Endolytic murein transglycosylase n=1 Tax=Rarispira pelagica TaxID=3141764 RepID=A0ABU9UB94_9SPIR
MNRIKFFIAIIIFFVIAISLLMGYGYYLNLPVQSQNNNHILVIVNSGDSAFKVSQKLYENNLIRSPLLFRILTKINNSASLLKQGGYLLSPAMSTYEIYKIILKGENAIVKVTIPEGWTSTRIAELLDKKRLIDSERFLSLITNKKFIKSLGLSSDSLEGYLFPDTYFFSYGQSGEEIITKIIDNFFKKVGTLISHEDIMSKDFYEKLILASIVEREYRLPEEAPLIASVFFNRLERRIPLESCATIDYVLTEERGEKNKLELTYDDLKVESPFNTYKYYGLPPAPISNPGLIAIKAVLYPPKTDFLYFVLKDPAKGKHYFSKTFEEHVRAKFLYLKPYKN